MSLRSCFALALLVAFSWTSAALVAPGYASTGVSVKGSDAAKPLAAFEKLNASAVMKGRKSRAFLLAMSPTESIQGIGNTSALSTIRERAL